MRKSVFKRLVDMLKNRPGGFKKLVENPAGSKMAARTLAESRRACDGTTRR